MTYADILNLDLTGKTVVIIGCPASGKTTLGKALAQRTGAKLIRTDDYMDFGYKEALYVMLADLIEIDEPVIVEGVQGYRLLRKGVELGNFFPDVVIELEVTEAQVKRVYETERIWDKRKSAEKMLASLAGFNKMHQTILGKYREMENPHPPTWYTVRNEF